jgi:hypothetical protein
MTAMMMRALVVAGDVAACAPFKIINGEECTLNTLPVVLLEIDTVGGMACVPELLLGRTGF